MKNLSLLIIFTFFYAINALAQPKHPYYGFEESFALSEAEKSGYYKISTFIPRAFLLFVEDRNKTYKIDKVNDYLKVITQDGVDAYVLENTVSKRTFNESLKDRQIIFNAEYKLCRIKGCIKSERGQIWQIYRGEAFKMESSEGGDFVKLSGDRIDNKIVGYLSRSELENLTKRGIITRADLHHPNYSITKFELHTLNTKCDEILEAKSKRTASREEQIQELDKLALKSFNIGKMTKGPSLPQIEFKDKYGESDKKYSFTAYHIKNKRTQEEFNLIALVVFNCKKQGIRKEPVQIEYVKIINPENDRTYELSFEDFKMPETVRKLLPGPFFFSVNSYDQYIDLLDRLSEIFDDRSLAGYFLSEYNRSLPLKHRSNESLIDYTYK